MKALTVVERKGLLSVIAFDNRIAHGIIQVNHDVKDDFILENYQNNVFLATFTTCHARLNLRRPGAVTGSSFCIMTLTLLSALVIQVIRNKQELGDYLGDPTDELIQDLGLLLSLPTVLTNVRIKLTTGKDLQYKRFSFHYSQQKLLNFDFMLELIQTAEDMSSTKRRKRTITTVYEGTNVLLSYTIEERKSNTKLYIPNEKCSNTVWILVLTTLKTDTN